MAEGNKTLIREFHSEEAVRLPFIDHIQECIVHSQKPPHAISELRIRYKECQPLGL